MFINAIVVALCKEGKLLVLWHTLYITYEGHKQLALLKI